MPQQVRQLDAVDLRKQDGGGLDDSPAAFRSQPRLDCRVGERIVGTREPTFQEQEIGERLEHDPDAFVVFAVAQIELLAREHAFFLEQPQHPGGIGPGATDHRPRYRLGGLGTHALPADPRELVQQPVEDAVHLRLGCVQLIAGSRGRSEPPGDRLDLGRQVTLEDGNPSWCPSGIGSPSERSRLSQYIRRKSGSVNSGVRSGIWALRACSAQSTSGWLDLALGESGCVRRT